MAVEKKDIEDVADALGKKFDEFKEKNDKRIEGLEAEKGKLSGQVDTLNEKLGELDELKSALEKELAGLKRPDGTGTKAAASIRLRSCSLCARASIPAWVICKPKRCKSVLKPMVATRFPRKWTAVSLSCCATHPQCAK